MACFFNGLLALIRQWCVQQNAESFVVAEKYDTVTKVLASLILCTPSM